MRRRHNRLEGRGQSRCSQLRGHLVQCEAPPQIGSDQCRDGRLRPLLRDRLDGRIAHHIASPGESHDRDEGDERHGHLQTLADVLGVGVEEWRERAADIAQPHLGIADIHHDPVCADILGRIADAADP